MPALTVPSVPASAPPTMGTRFPTTYLTPLMPSVSARLTKTDCMESDRESKNMTSPRAPVYQRLARSAMAERESCVPSASEREAAIQRPHRGGVRYDAIAVQRARKSKNNSSLTAA